MFYTMISTRLIYYDDQNLLVCGNFIARFASYTVNKLDCRPLSAGLETKRLTWSPQWFILFSADASVFGDWLPAYRWKTEGSGRTTRKFKQDRFLFLFPSRNLAGPKT